MRWRDRSRPGREVSVGAQESLMNKAWLAVGVAGLILGGCDGAKDEPAAATPTAAAAAGGETLATGLDKAPKLAAAIKTAGLEPALAGPTPYTLLAPGDAAFDKLPPGELDRLMKPEGRADLTAILSHHVLPGTMLASDIAKAVDSGGGKAQIRTLGGGTLTATKSGGRLQFTDAAGTVASVAGADDMRSNGIIHHVDALLMPAK
jgi:uncharacterized surface protein with fasciclin (FAS1) repeats